MTPGAPGRGSSARLPLEGFRVGPAGHRGRRKTFLSESLVNHKALTNISGEGAEEITGGLPQARAAGTSDGRVRGAGRRRQAWQRPPPLQGGPRDDGVVPVGSDLRHGGLRASDKKGQEGCCTKALTSGLGGEAPCLSRPAVPVRWAVRGEAGRRDRSHGLLRTAAPVRPAASSRPAARDAPASAAAVPGHGVEGHAREARRSQTGCLRFVLGLGSRTVSCLQLPATYG